MFFALEGDEDLAEMGWGVLSQICACCIWSLTQTKTNDVYSLQDLDTAKEKQSRSNKILSTDKYNWMCKGIWGNTAYLEEDNWGYVYINLRIWMYNYNFYENGFKLLITDEAITWYKKEIVLVLTRLMKTSKEKEQIWLIYILHIYWCHKSYSQYSQFLLIRIQKIKELWLRKNKKWKSHLLNIFSKHLLKCLVVKSPS